MKLLLTLMALVCFVPSASHGCLANEGQAIMQATFRLTDGRTSGTAWLVSVPAENENLKTTVVVTAAHVFKNLNGEIATLILRKKNDDGSFERLEHKFSIRENERSLWEQHIQYDIAAIKIALPKEAAVKPIPLNQLTKAESAAPSLAPAQPCLIPTFPAQMEGNRAGWPVLRNATVASFPNAPVNRHPQFILDFNAFGGDSGAPVILNLQNSDSEHGLKIVGMILGQHRQTDRTITPNEERTVHTSLGLGIAVQAAFIRETIAKVK
ncbi:MAG: trypsin-like serine protease [Mariniblastus sp.]